MKTVAATVAKLLENELQCKLHDSGVGCGQDPAKVLVGYNHAGIARRSRQRLVQARRQTGTGTPGTQQAT